MAGRVYSHIANIAHGNIMLSNRLGSGLGSSLPYAFRLWAMLFAGLSGK